jgi:hypothetical protein
MRTLIGRFWCWLLGKHARPIWSTMTVAEIGIFYSDPKKCQIFRRDIYCARCKKWIRVK